MTAQHVWLNGQDIILVPFLLYEYSHTAVCDMQIAAGELGPPTDTLVPRLDRSCGTRAKAGSPCPAHPKIPPVTPSYPHQSTQQRHCGVGHFQKKEFDATNNHPGLINTQ